MPEGAGRGARASGGGRGAPRGAANATGAQATHAQQQTFQAGSQGRGECIACKEAGREEFVFLNRMFPNTDGDPVIIHQCPVTKSGEVLFATPVTEE